MLAGAPTQRARVELSGNQPQGVTKGTISHWIKRVEQLREERGGGPSVQESWVIRNNGSGWRERFKLGSNQTNQALNPAMGSSLDTIDKMLPTGRYEDFGSDLKQHVSTRLVHRIGKPGHFNHS